MIFLSATTPEAEERREMDDDVSLSSSYFRDYSNKKNNITLTLSLSFSQKHPVVFLVTRVCVCDSNLAKRECVF